jgi:hypothetical protein
VNWLRAKRDEPRLVVVTILDIGDDDAQAESAGRRMRGHRREARIAKLRDLTRGRSGVEYAMGLHARMRAKERLALRDGDRMTQDRGNGLECSARRAKQTMVNTDHCFCDCAQRRRSIDGFVGESLGPDESVLDRQNGTISPPARDRRDRVGVTGARDRDACGAEEHLNGVFGVGAEFTLERDAETLVRGHAAEDANERCGLPPRAGHPRAN